MKLLNCPKWVQDEDSTLPDIAQAASAFLRFAIKQNPRRYLLTHGDVKQWHKKLFEKVAPVPYYAGNYRGSETSKPCLDTDVHVAGVFGTPVHQVAEEMQRFSDELVRATQATDAFITASQSRLEQIKAAAHLAAFAGGSIIRIHPFVNGNGRIARLTMNFFLHRYLDRMPFYIDRPTHPDYSSASRIAMEGGNYGPLYQYLIEIIALG